MVLTYYQSGALVGHISPWAFEEKLFPFSL